MVVGLIVDQLFRLTVLHEGDIGLLISRMARVFCENSNCNGGTSGVRVVCHVLYPSECFCSVFFC